ncbi:MAG: RICIN domain-containing protein [Thalassotalea sp.]
MNIKTNNKFRLSIALLGTCISSQVFAGYPFVLPANVNASIDINTTNQETYNNKLLGTNIFGFTTATEQALIERNEPITVRFPHGLWANWYDWETDGTRVFGTDSFEYNRDNGVKTTSLDHLAEIKIFDNANIKVGIEGLTDLNTTKKSNTGKGYDMLWTFNMSADGTNFNNGSPVTVSRYNDMIGRGFEVKAVELGNENFYPGQRSSIIPNVEEYLQRAKSMSAALKAQDSSIRVSVPMLRRDSAANASWNQDLAADLSYFDAVTVHTYVGSDPDVEDSPDGAYGTALTARHHLAASVDDYAGQVAPNKPIWLSEWGVKSGGPNAVSVLGMADAYIFMSENQDRYERANWFSVNGQLNSFYVWETYTAPNGAERPRIKYPLEKTAVGSSYEIIRGVFEDSTLLASDMTSPDLMAGVDAVSATAVVKDGITTVFVLNLTNKSVPFTVNLDGTNYNGYFKHEAMQFSWMGAEKVLPIDTNPLEVIKQGSGAITLPKFSMSTITLNDANVVVNTKTYVQLTKANSSAFSLDGGNGGANNQNVKLWSTNSNNINQQWEEIHRGANYYSYKKRGTQFCLDAGNNGANNQNVKLWLCDYQNQNQHFTKVSRGGDNYQLNKRNADGYAIDGGTGGANNQNVKLWQAQTSTSNNQVWQFTEVD